MRAKRSRGSSTEIEGLRERLREAEETLAAIRSGEVDSIVVDGADGPKVYALEGSSAVYRELIDGMSEGAVSLDRKGVVTYCNRRFAEMLGRPLEAITGTRLVDLLARGDRPAAARFFRLAWKKAARTEMTLPGPKGRPCPVLVSGRPVQDGQPLLCLVVTDVSEARRAEAERLQRALDDARLKGLTDRINEIELVVKMDGAIVHANDRAVKAYGYPREELLRRNIRDLRETSTRGAARGQRAEAARRGVRFETTHVRRDGTTFPVLVSSRGFKVGRLKYLHSVIQDLTEARALEEERTIAARALADSERRLAEVIEASNEGYFVRELEAGTVFRSPRLNELEGRPREESGGADAWMAAVRAEDRAMLGQGLEAMARGRADTFEADFRARGPGGSWEWRRVRAKVITRDEQGKARRIAGVVADVHALRTAQEAIAASERRYRALLELSPDAIFIDRDGRIELANASAAALFGFDRPGDLIGHPTLELVVPDGRADAAQLVSRSAAGEHPGRVDIQVLRRDGAIREVEGEGRLLQDERGKFLLVAARDVTERRAAERELARAHEALRNHVTNTPLAVVEWDADYRVRSFRGRAEAIFGWTEAEVLGKRIDEVPWVPEEDWPKVRAVMAAIDSGSAPTIVSRNRNLRKDGAVLHCEWYNSTLRGPDGKLRSVFSLVQDVTARVLAEVALRDRETKLTAYFNTEAVGIAVVTPGKAWVDVSDTYCAMMGYPREEIEKLTWMDLTHPDDRESSEREFNRVLAGEIDGYTLDKRFVRKDGSSLWALLAVSCVRRADRSVEFFVGVVRDITLRKQAEESLRAVEAALREQQEHLDLAASSGKLGLWDLDLATNEVWRTLQHDRLFGYDEMQASWGPEEAERHVLPQDRPIFQRAFDEAFATGHFHYELRINPADKPMRWLEATGEVIRDGTGKPVRMRGVVADVTERKVAEERVAEAAAYARSLIEASLDPLVTISPEGKITDVNGATEEATGVPRTRLVGTDFADYFTDPERARAGYEKVLAEGVVRDYPLTLRHVSGRSIEVIYNAAVYSDAKGKALGVFAAARDVSDRKKAEEALRASEARFRALAEEAPVGIYQTDAQGRNVYLNRAGQVITGQSAEEAGGTGWNASLHPDDRERVEHEFAAAIASGKVFEGEYRFLRKDGTSVLARGFATALRDPAGAITGYIGVVMDISAMKALEVQLALASRLAAMGTLVAGVAHEVNNPLAAALADQGLARESVQEVRERLRRSEPIDREREVRLLDSAIEELQDAEEGGWRIAQIVKDLSAFGRQGTERTRVRLIDVVNQAMRWLPATVGQVASVRLEDGGAPDVVASFGQIEQVVVNLVTNAAKATKPGAPGTIIVRVGPGSPGMARLDVTDVGVGIPPAIRDRIFDPFFTTRQVGEGKGMGLGLAVSHTIVANHRGTLTVESEVGKGSTFRMELPAALGDG